MKMINVHFVKQKKIIVKNVQVKIIVQNVKVVIIQLMEFVCYVNHNIVQKHVMFQKEHVMDV